ncbi:carbohydrate ABC transporter permease [Enterococcus phoeniculicola]|uniref:ABC transmembrane type-1 domain-containing protein n=1 Tax=Enterococcus phoeniculicola ATCC BAA-412 TaxID=1158610 RepID=R3TKS2_9ENTE|nr:carbohydrate ABC transporter permease [Enterococcus phoeniculicola]EOL41668.1 hypothetical protein UC3_03233 [Enterococcus phoeniculicola ATCC BAA-412]EOT78838.1 hypothetical protein I589_00343 [Enterococcus phoeniculicola ATCC BAA-412]
MNNLAKSKSKFLVILLSFLAFIWTFPFIFTVVSGLKSSAEYNSTDFWNLPKAIGLSDTFSYISERIMLNSSMVNSLIYALGGTFFAILISCLAAYGLTKLRIKGSFYWFMIIYSGTIFPFQLYLVPIYSAFLKTGLYDTKLGMLLLYTAICIPFCTFVLRNFFLGVENSIIDSAKIDGCSDFKILRSIIIPMAQGPIAALFLTQFSFIWNDLLFGLTFSKSDNVRPVMSLLSSLVNSGTSSNVPALLVSCFIASIPTVLVFALTNKNLEKGFVIGGK